MAQALIARDGTRSTVIFGSLMIGLGLFTSAAGSTAGAARRWR